MSAYAVKFAAAVKVNGKVLREETSANQDPTVYLPFGSEYTLFFKNLNSQKAVVKVSIDGQDVLNGRSIIVNPNSTVELERFLSDLNTGNKFLFLEKTEQISDFRGDRVDDGIIRISYQFEEFQQRYTKSIPTWGNEYWKGGYNNFLVGSPVFSSSNSVGSTGIMNCSNTSIDGSTSKSVTTAVRCANTEGITSHGSISNQKFSQGYVGTLAPEVYVITIKLKGKTDNSVVEAPITTKMKCQCEMCGEVFRGFPQFCSKCGTAINAKI